MSVGQIIGVLVLLALVAMIYFSFPPEPEENVAARKRYGKISKEEQANGTIRLETWRLKATGLNADQIANQLGISVSKVREFY